MLEEKGHFIENVKHSVNPYIIAEIGANHNGDVELAKKLILEAKNSGCNCVKFQSWSKNTIFSTNFYNDNVGLEEEVVKYSTSEEELIELKRYADQIGIDFSSTPFSIREVDFLVNKIKPPFIKVASMDLNNYPFLEYIAKKGLPIVLSTGLSTLAEIDEAVKTIEGTGNRSIVLLHCVANYPPKDENLNLNNIDMLKSNYPNYPIGFSDHTIGTLFPLIAISIGAKVIEKHFTLDKNMEGWDHAVSATPEEMKAIVIQGERVVNSLGSYQRVLSKDDLEKIKVFRRSIVAAREIPEGKIIEREDLDFKRPGTGIQPKEVNWLIGKKARRTIKYDELINCSDF